MQSNIVSVYIFIIYKKIRSHCIWYQLCSLGCHCLKYSCQPKCLLWCRSNRAAIIPQRLLLLKTETQFELRIFLLILLLWIWRLDTPVLLLRDFLCLTPLLMFLLLHNMLILLVCLMDWIISRRKHVYITPEGIKNGMVVQLK